ncbi:hypothetical protein [Desulfobacter sp.]|uniref:hypothetical protein n=1 Tax=Desulfobacter sp. TaxID=2294 RepID=UPI00257EEF20|nr:hypothetical protein [Desulfobacter sp.]
MVLPGTAFRRQALDFGLEFSSYPPYPVMKTSAFSQTDMVQALDYAEDASDRTFLPFPDLEISFITPGSKDYYICPDNRRLLAKLVLDTPPSPGRAPYACRLYNLSFPDLFHLDGILIPAQGQALLHWQDVMAEIHEDIPPVSFADISLQIRWLSMTEKDKCPSAVFNAMQ